MNRLCTEQKPYTLRSIKMSVFISAWCSVTHSVDDNKLYVCSVHRHHACIVVFVVADSAVGYWGGSCHWCFEIRILSLIPSTYQQYEIALAHYPQYKKWSVTTTNGRWKEKPTTRATAHSTRETMNFHNNFIGSLFALWLIAICSRCFFNTFALCLFLRKLICICFLFII